MWAAKQPGNGPSMSRTRDIIQEISEIRQRRRFGSSMTELPIRLSAMAQAFEARKDVDPEFIKYFPVALIACIEGYFRMVIQELIDAGEPFLSNAEATGQKIDFSILRAIHGKTITVGEMVAHSVSISSFEHINKWLGIFLGKDFVVALRTVHDRWAVEILKEPLAPVLQDPNSVFAGVKRTFELRHIICHEIASAYEINSQEIESCFEHCIAFLKASDELIAETLFPGAPLTQTDMNIAAGESLQYQTQIMETAIAKLRSDFEISDEQNHLFEESQRAWEAYSDIWGNFTAGGSRAEGGTIWPLIYAKAREETVKKRIEEIAEYEPLGR